MTWNAQRDPGQLRQSIRSRLGPPLKQFLPHVLEIGSYDKHGIVEDFLTREEAGFPVRTLDVGCGNGYFTGEASRRGAGPALGITIAESERESAVGALRRRGGDHLIEIRVQTLAEAAATEAGGSFHQVLLLDVLEHIRDDEGALKSVCDLLPPDGRLILTVPNRDFEWRRATQISYEESGWHVRNGYTFEQLELLLERTGFEPVDRRRYGNWLSCALIRFQSTPRLYGKLWPKAVGVLPALIARNVVPQRAHTLGVIARRR